MIDISTINRYWKSNFWQLTADRFFLEIFDLIDFLTKSIIDQIRALISKKLGQLQYTLLPIREIFTRYTASSMCSRTMREKKMLDYSAVNTNAIQEWFMMSDVTEVVRITARAQPDMKFLANHRRWHRDIPYIVSGTTPFRALLLVHFSQCLLERIFFSFW